MAIIPTEIEWGASRFVNAMQMVYPNLQHRNGSRGKILCWKSKGTDAGGTHGSAFSKNPSHAHHGIHIASPQQIQGPLSSEITTWTEEEFQSRPLIHSLG